VDKELQEYAEADLITVPSTFAYRSFVEKGVTPDRIRKLPYGVDLSLFYPVPKEDDRFRVLFVGGYSLRKGINYLFEAVRPLVQKRNIEVWLVGTPSSEAREILDRNVDVFTDKGSQPRSKLAWFYSQSSVLVLPSIEDGFGLVLAQAMACRVPVIATTNTGAEDLITDGVEGFIVPTRDPDIIRDRIQWMLDNPAERQAMGEAALRRVKSLGGWDKYGETAIAVYRQLLNGQRS
jgi:glycosyltransferase involved in cell wall biosynthesis